MSKTTYNIPEESSNQTISINGRTLSISDGNSIELPDRDNQTLNIADHQLTISNGNTVQLPNDKQTIIKSGNKVLLSNNGGEVELPAPYDDSDVKRRLGVLEAKPDKDGQTLNLDSSTRVLSISNGNSVTIPNDKQTISKQGNKLVLSNGGGEVDLPQPNNAVSYDDTNLRNRVGALEAKTDNDKQTLTLNNRTLSISGGNSVTLPEDRDTVYNDADVKRRLTVLEGKTDNFVTGVTATRTGNKVKLTYNFVTGNPKTVEFDDKDTIGIAYDDTALRNRVQALENKPSGVVHRFYNGDISGRAETNTVVTVNKNNFRNPDGIKVGDTAEDYWADQTVSNRGIWKVIEVSDNNVKVQCIGNYDTILKKNLAFNANTRSLSIDGGNNVTLPNDKQTISKSGNKIVLSNGGGEVDIPTATPYNDADIKRRLGVLEAKRDNDNQTLSVSGNNLTISGGNSVAIPQPDLRGYVSISAYNEVKDALVKLLQDLKNSGAWEQTGDNILAGRLKDNRHIATGNINLFGGQPDGNSFIRTNNGSTENDLTGGI